MKHIILLGKPCSGKGTISKQLVDSGFIHISGSDVLRENSKEESMPFYKEAQHALTTGMLISDDIMNGMMENKVKSLEGQRMVFDGFPRSIGQANQLLSILPEGDEIVAVYLDVDDSVIIDRVLNRLTCQECAASYNTTTMKPKEEGVCDRCGGVVSKRVDDTEETLKVRLEQYDKLTAPVMGYLTAKIKVESIQEPSLEKILSV